MLEENYEESFYHDKSVNRESLCHKYDININQLDFNYIADCKNSKELEKIVRILRSGEEGYYPELQLHAEKRLNQIAPGSRLLRAEEPVIRKSTMKLEERTIIDKDMKEWADNMISKDEELTDWNKNFNNDLGSVDYNPPIRRAPPIKDSNLKKSSNNFVQVKKPINSYDSWDKYDADAELLKMEAEEEKKRVAEETQVRKRKAAESNINKKAELSRLNLLVETTKNLSHTEKLFFALAEKDRGNEFYKTCDYDNAIEYYTASVVICPNPIAYSNRAAVYLKQGKYDLALRDVNKCLELDDENVKALYRRGLCLQHKNKFNEAYQDILVVLRKEPNNLSVQHMAKQLRDQIKSVPQSVRMLIKEQEELKVKEVYDNNKELKVGAGYEINEWGLAKNVCRQCNGRLSFMKRINDCGIADHLIYRSETDRKNELMEDDEDYYDGEDNLNDELEDSGGDKIKNDSAGGKSLLNGDAFSNNNMNYNYYSSNYNFNNNNNKITELSSSVKITELPCNVSKGSNDPDKCTIGLTEENVDEVIPKKVKIVETVKSVNESNQKKCIVKDMRDKKPVQGQKELDMIDQMVKVSICDSVLNKTETKNMDTNGLNDINEYSNEEIVALVSSYEEPEMEPVRVASKYESKTSKQINCQNNASFYNGYANVNNNNNSNNNVLKSYNAHSTNKEPELTPYKFLQTWSSVKSADSLKEYANMLRQIKPEDLRKVLGNNLDYQILSSILETLTKKFSETGESDLAMQYLVELAKVDRFNINVQFLSSQSKQNLRSFLDKWAGDEAVILKQTYHCNNL